MTVRVIVNTRDARTAGRQSQSKLSQRFDASTHHRCPRGSGSMVAWEAGKGATRRRAPEKQFTQQQYRRTEGGARAPGLVCVRQGWWHCAGRGDRTHTYSKPSQGRERVVGTVMPVYKQSGRSKGCGAVRTRVSMWRPTIARKSRVANLLPSMGRSSTTTWAVTLMHQLFD